MPDLPVDLVTSDLSLAPRGIDKQRLALSGWVTVLAASDVIGGALLAFVTLHTYATPPGHSGGELTQGICEFVIAWGFASWSQHLYGNSTLLADGRTHGLRGVLTSMLAFGIMLPCSLTLQLTGSVPTIWLPSWAVGVSIWVLGLRLLWSRYLPLLLKKGGALERALVVAESSTIARTVGEDIQRESLGKVGIAFVAGLPGTQGGPPINWVERAVRDGTVEHVFIVGCGHADAELRALLQRLERVAVDVTLIPNLGPLRRSGVASDCIGTMPALSLLSRPLSAMGAALKRTEDLLLGGIILLAAMPLFAVASIAIKLDSRGPVLFGQERQGYHDHTFKMLKFRTMFDEASDPVAAQQTSRNDCRVTRVGRFLRRFSIDELPQVINVLRGDMSIVGPRPHALGMTFDGVPIREVVRGYSERHRMRPGITGWAQVNGCRGAIDSYEKVERRIFMDCYYIRNWSLLLDFWILIRTARALLFDSDAY